ncbi:hypothetical protein [Ottowia thiooxydans]
MKFPVEVPPTSIAIKRCGWKIVSAMLVTLGSYHAGAHSAPSTSSSTNKIPNQVEIQQALGTLSIPFEQNTGQFDANIAFMGNTFAGAVYVTQDGKMIYRLPGKPVSTQVKSGIRLDNSEHFQKRQERGPGWQLTESLVRALPMSPQGRKGASTHVARFTPQGRFSSPTWQSVTVGEPWPGVVLELAARGHNIEKLFHVSPGADASQIAVKVEGATSLALGKDGSLVVGTGNGEISYTAPIAWQEIGGKRFPVEVRYTLQSEESALSPEAKDLSGTPNRYGFVLARHDPSYPLVIDPLIQSTYVGGTDSQDIYSIVIDSNNADVLVGGESSADSVPCVSSATSGCANGAQSTYAGGSSDAFVARLSGDLRTFKQSTYLGGSGAERIFSLALDTTNGDLLVAGSTSSANLPCVTASISGCANAAQSIFAGGDPGMGGDTDGFIARLSGNLQTLKQSTYLGGTGAESIQKLVLDASSGDVLVAGQTFSSDLPCTTIASGCVDGAQPSRLGLSDSFVARLSGNLQTLRQSTYLGGSGWDLAYGLAVSSNGDVVLAGYTEVGDFPCTSTASSGCVDGAQATYGGGLSDGFVSLLSGNLQTLKQSTYLGGSDSEMILTLTLDETSNDVLVGGVSSSTDLPCLTNATPGCGAGAQSAYGGNSYDGFVTRLSGDLLTFRQSTLLGGSGIDWLSTLVLDPNSGDVLVAGYTSSTDLPCITVATAGCASGAQTAFVDVPGGMLGIANGFVSRLSGNLQTLRQSTYLGGTQRDLLRALALDANGDVVVAGGTLSSDFPCTTSAPDGCSDGAQLASGTGGDGFVTRLSGDLKRVSSQFITFPPQIPAVRGFVSGLTFTINPLASASSGLPVSYSSGTPGICSVSGNVVTVLGLGTCDIIAAQAGSDNYTAATPQTSSVQIAALPPGAATITAVPLLEQWWEKTLLVLLLAGTAWGLRSRQTGR